MRTTAPVSLERGSLGLVLRRGLGAGAHGVNRVVLVLPVLTFDIGQQQVT